METIKKSRGEDFGEIGKVSFDSSDSFKMLKIKSMRIGSGPFDNYTTCIEDSKGNHYRISSNFVDLLIETWAKEFPNANVWDSVKIIRKKNK